MEFWENLHCCTAPIHLGKHKYLWQKSEKTKVHADLSLSSFTLLAMCNIWCPLWECHATCLMKTALTDVYIYIYCLHICWYNNLWYYIYMCYIYNGSVLWWAIYIALVGHTIATSDWLLIYTIYTIKWICIHMYSYGNSFT